MSRTVTLMERREIALRKRRAALEEAEARLANAALRHGGRYLIFGSVAVGRLTPASDLDVLAEFPEETVNEAISEAEGIAIELQIPMDLMDWRRCNDRFLSSVLPNARVAGCPP